MDEEIIVAEETLVYSEDLNSFVTRIAPGESNVPIPFNRDPDAEVASFPTIYCGQERTIKPKVKLSYTDIAKSEIRRYDRRCANPEKILFMFKYSFCEKVQSAYQICLRQKKRGLNGRNITAADLKSANGVQNIIAKDDGYAVFKNIRSSPAYWKEQTKRVVAMVRQLGKCTFFITLSAAETKWTEVLVMLEKLVNGHDITEEEAARLPADIKAHLIRSDPVTCMIHFDRKYKVLLKELFKKEHGIFEPYKTDDYYSRIEFQMRGSPHSHGLYWIENAPTYTPGNKLKYYMLDFSYKIIYINVNVSKSHILHLNQIYFMYLLQGTKLLKEGVLNLSTSS